MKWTKSQEKVLTDEGNLLVSASAGSGKTTIMLQKVIELLKKGKNIDRFLVMTFTNASAAEMREKLIKKLYDEIRTTSNSHLKKQLELLNFSNISTIDSFCLSLYKKYFAEMGLEPAFELMDDKESKLLFVECTDEVLENYMAKENDEYFYLLIERFVKRRDINPLREVIREVSDYLDIQADEQKYLKKCYELMSKETEKHPAIKLYIDYHTKILRRYLDEGQRLITQVKINELPDGYVEFLENITQNLSSILKEKSLHDFAIKINNFALLYRKPNCKKDTIYLELDEEIKDYKNIVGEHIKKLKEDLEDYSNFGVFLKGSAKDIIKLLETTEMVRAHYQNRKQKKKKFDFADLSKIALKILSVKKLRDEISDSFDYIFVDEYQDTNYIQESIINLIGKKDNLFMVGDPKQAIYQFRHAEPKIFIERYYRYSHINEGINENLNENFRSDKRILDFVNLVFREIMYDEFGGVNYRNNAEFTTIEELEYPVVSSLPAVEVAFYEKDKKEKTQKTDVYSVKDDVDAIDKYDYEGAYISERIQSIVNHSYIYDSSIKAKRLVEYRDIAILMYKRNSNKILNQLSINNIPYSAPGFSRERIYEINLLVDYLRIIDNMKNDIPLSSVMQSALYKFSKREMLEIRKTHPKGYFWESLLEFSGNEAIQNKINYLINDLSRYRKMLAYFDVYNLMLTILGDGFDAFLLSEGEDITAQVNTFINSIKDRDYSRNITDFIEYYDKAFDNKLSIPASVNAVKLMTIHNSKGLEFPIVFVADAHSSSTNNKDTSKDLYLDDQLGMAIKYFNEQDKIKKDTLLIKCFKLKKQYEKREEFLRLMYVALTRAKNHLFIVGENSVSKHKYPDMQDSFAQWINFAKTKNPDIDNRYFINLVQKETDTSTLQQKIVINPEAISLDKLDYEYAYSESCITPAKFSVSSLKDQENIDFTQTQETVSYLTEEQKIQRGIAYHKIIELIDFNVRDMKGIEEQVAIFVKQGYIKEEMLSEIDLEIIYQTLNSEVIEYARKNKYIREKRFMLYLPYDQINNQTKIKDKVLVQGAIDLLIMGERNIIVDFKVTQSADEALKIRYKKQLDLYKLAAEKLLDIKIHQKIIYIINKNAHIIV